MDTIEVYSGVTTVDYPRDEENEILGMVHDHLQVRNYYICIP